MPANNPFFFQWNSKTHQKVYDALETIILQNIPDAQGYFWKVFIECKPLLLDELENTLVNYQRTALAREQRRSQIALGLLRHNLPRPEAGRLLLRRAILAEAYAGATLGRCHMRRAAVELRKL